MNNPSRDFLNDLSTKDKIEVALKAEISTKYIYDIAAGRRTPSRELIIILEMLTCRGVKDSDFYTETREHIKERVGL